MCGLAAVFTSGSSLEPRQSVMREMLNSIAHRGPDGSGIHHITKQALLGHVRLAIIDLQHGTQPMTTSDGRYSLIFNGEIYNYRELRENLERAGFSFITESDTEVLLQLLVSNGKSAIKLLNGMFAFLFHDRVENTWIAARDHFGIKPLYYSTAGNELVFASEIKALLVHPAIRAERDNHSLFQYMSFQFCLDERTLFKGVKKLRPGFYLTGCGSNILEEICYWDVDYEIDQHHNEKFFSEKLLELLSDSVNLQMRSDVPLGAYVSGGVDSSLVYQIAAEIHGKAMPMFHGRFAEGPQYDEAVYAKAVAKKSRGIYFEIVPTSTDFVQNLPKLIEALDEPLAGPGLFAQYSVSKLASEHVKVVLGGQGGDEIFGGYARYLIGYLEQALKGSILETQEEGNHLVSLESVVPNLSILKQYTPLLRKFWSKGLFDEMDARYFHLIDRSDGLAEIISAEALEAFNQEQLFSDFQAVFNRANTKSYINKMTHFDQKTLLPALLQVEDRVSMAVSLESRVPLLDKRIVELVASMPPALKFQGGRTKHLLKKTVGHLLPDLILNRKDKMGFPVPLVEWMTGGVVRDFVCDTLLSQASMQRGIYKTHALHAMIDNQGVGARQLWGALSLELWHQRFIDGK